MGWLGKPIVIRESSLAAYFRQRLLDSARRLESRPQEETFWYLGNLLERFAESGRLFAYRENRLDLRPLALLYKDALEVDDDRQRCLILQHLGDMALFLGAVFPRYFAHRSIHQDYVVSMGGASYDYLGSNARQNQHIFSELGGSFAQILELVSDACTRRSAPGAEDVLALYERWLSTGEPLIGSQLAGLGIDLSGSNRWH